MENWPPRPSLSPSFYKAHGLGNDYLVFEEGSGWTATEENVRHVCERHAGVGSDGIVALLAGSGTTPDEELYRASLRMFNPDGSEFERSGNGLRVLASYVAVREPRTRTILASVGGDTVRMVLHGREGRLHDVSVEMGRARTGPEAVALDPSLLTEGVMSGPSGEALRVVPVSVGNPHLVVIVDRESALDEDRLRRLGPFLATHEGLANGANVQLAIRSGPFECAASIWERGVGPTSASGTSACAVAVALTVAGELPCGAIDVRMPGGTLRVAVDSDLDVVLRGPVEEVMEGKLRSELVGTLPDG